MVLAASQISQSGPHILIISSSQGDSSLVVFVGSTHLKNATNVKSNRMCLWAWVRRGWVYTPPRPPSLLAILPWEKSSSLFMRQPHKEALRAREWSLLTITMMCLDVEPPSKGSQLGAEMVAWSAKCFIGSWKPAFNPPQSTLRKSDLVDLVAFR